MKWISAKLSRQRIAIALPIAVATAPSLAIGTANTVTTTPSPAYGDWQVAGRQGVVFAVIVPASVGADKAAYDRQIGRLCPAGRTCFVNFYTNSTGAKVDFPLPDRIASELTATFRRSMKNQAELFRWSCRVNGSEPTECF